MTVNQCQSKVYHFQLLQFVQTVNFHRGNSIIQPLIEQCSNLIATNHMISRKRSKGTLIEIPFNSKFKSKIISLINHLSQIGTSKSG